jgi:hypothetical protein
MNMMGVPIDVKTGPAKGHMESFLGTKENRFELDSETPM